MIVLLRDTLLTLVFAAVIFFGLQATVQSIIVEGPSMNPSFDDGERILVNKVLYKFREPARGDVIILHPPPPHGPKETPFIKRIIGLPGESVEIKTKIVYIHTEDGRVVPLD